MGNEKHLNSIMCDPTLPLKFLLIIVATIELADSSLIESHSIALFQQVQVVTLNQKKSYFSHQKIMWYSSLIQYVEKLNWIIDS